MTTTSAATSETTMKIHCYLDKTFVRGLESNAEVTEENLQIIREEVGEYLELSGKPWNKMFIVIDGGKKQWG